jgi:uncharacterized protein (TIGR02453 family)
MSMQASLNQMVRWFTAQARQANLFPLQKWSSRLSAQFTGFGPDIFRFFKALDFHQSREWFAQNKALYEAQAREPMGDLVEALSARLAGEGFALRGDRKASLFRLNRDVRFAKDKRPYNRHVSAILSPDGTRKSRSGIFYVHVGLDECFTAIGWYQPDAALLKAFRHAIITRPSDFDAMSSALAKNGIAISSEDALKRLPRGFDSLESPEMEAAVRNRHFIVRQEIDPASVHDAGLEDLLLAFCRSARPLLDWGSAIERDGA